MRDWPRHLMLCCLLAAVAVMPGCGKKGPLYLPTEPTPPAPPATVPTTSAPAPNGTATTTTPPAPTPGSSSTTPTTTP